MSLSVPELVAAMARCEAENPIIDYVLPRDIALMAEGLALCRYRTLHEGAPEAVISLEGLRPEVVEAISRWLKPAAAPMGVGV